MFMFAFVLSIDAQGATYPDDIAVDRRKNPEMCCELLIAHNKSDTIRPKSSVLSWLLDSSIICELVHRLNLCKLKKNCCAFTS